MDDNVIELNAEIHGQDLIDDLKAKFHVAFSSGNFEECVNLLEHIIINSFDVDEKVNSVFMMGTCLYKLGRWDDAIEALEYIEEVMPSSPVYHILGVCYGELNEFRTAEQYLKQAIEIDPNTAIIVDALAWLYVSMGDSTNALQ
jgi:tetratricopeptide (TPR) repeat protein